MRPDISHFVLLVISILINKLRTYATATDYDPRDEMTKMFFATVQNKLHYAVH